MKALLLILLCASASLLVAAEPRPTFLISCPNSNCTLGTQRLKAKKVVTNGITTTTNGCISERTITFKCKKHGVFTARDKVFVPTQPKPIEVKK